MKKFKFYLIGLLAAANMTSCLVDDEVDSYTQNMDYIVGFDQATATLSYFEDEGVVTKYYPISLKGSKDDLTYDKDIDITVSVDPSSTAVQGTEYEFSVTTVTMAAGTDYILLPVDVYTGSFNTEMPTTLVINIATDTEDTVVAAAYSTLTIQFVGCISQIQTGSYTATFGSQSTLYAGLSYSENISNVGINTFKTSHTPPYLGSYESPAGLQYGFEFTDVCGDLTVPSQYLFDYYINEVVGVYTTDDVLSNQQGAVIDEDTFVLFFNVSYSSSYYSYVTYHKN